MKEELKNRITALRIIEQLPHGEIKKREIEVFFTWWLEVSPNNLATMSEIDNHVSGGIRFRSVLYKSRIEDALVRVTIVQDDKDDMIIIDADFNDDED